jgi:hypothetical protein
MNVVWCGLCECGVAWVQGRQTRKKEAAASHMVVTQGPHAPSLKLPQINACIRESRVIGSYQSTLCSCLLLFLSPRLIARSAARSGAQLPCARHGVCERAAAASQAGLLAAQAGSTISPTQQLQSAGTMQQARTTAAASAGAACRWRHRVPGRHTAQVWTGAHHRPAQ